MRNRFTIIFYIALSLVFITHIKASEPEADTCRPNFSDIFNFEVGNVFQFRHIKSTSAGGTNPTTEEIIQYTIMDKYKGDSTFEYYISGWSNTLNYTNTNIDGDTTDFVELFDTLISFTDSADHILNACPQTILPLYEQGINELGFGTIYTMVQLDKNDSIFTKTIGGKDNIFYYTNDTLRTIPEITYKAVYQARMGLISMKSSFFETKETLILEGFLSASWNMDTIGTIFPSLNPNQEFIDAPSEKVNFQVNKNFFYPNPASGQIILSSEEEFLNIEIYNLSATKILDIQHPSSTIDISGLLPGVYTVRAITASQNNLFISQLIVY